MIRAYFDGSCEPRNPGGTAAYGIAIYQDDKLIHTTSRLFVPEKGKEIETSNNVAEYSGFKAILEYLIENGLFAESISIFGDSQLVIMQMTFQWSIKHGFYVPIARECLELLDWFPRLHLHWIPREENEFADMLSRGELKKVGIRFRI